MDSVMIRNAASALATMGYTLEANSWGNLGDIQAIMQSGGVVQAASDSRGRGTADVFGH